MIDRIESKATPVETALGFIPKKADLDLSGLDIDDSKFSKLFEIKKDEWTQEVGEIGKFYDTFGGTVPQELLSQLTDLKKKISAI